MIVLQPDLRFENAELVTLLGALEALYVVSTFTYILYTHYIPVVKYFLYFYSYQTIYILM